MVMRNQKRRNQRRRRMNLLGRNYLEKRNQRRGGFTYRQS
jgi:hypothetical protein